MNFQCSDDLKGGVVFYLGIDSSRSPAVTLAKFIWTKTRVQLVDLPKVCW